MITTTVCQLQKYLRTQHPDRTICYSFDNDPTPSMREWAATDERVVYLKRRVQALEDKFETIGTICAQE